jgi:four helix bundle protein
MSASPSGRRLKLKTLTFNLKLSSLKVCDLSYRSFEDLDVWKRACRVAVRVYELLRDCRDYGLRDQMTRAAVSIASNIAEGSERNSSADYVRFLHIAKGSAAELRTQLYVAQRVGLIDQAAQIELTQECKELSAMLQGLIKSLRRQGQQVKG